MTQIPTNPSVPSMLVVDTMALIWYLKTDKRLGSTASRVFEAAERNETRLVCSAITLAEMYYADQKRRLFNDFTLVYTDLMTRSYLSFVPFHPQDVLLFAQDARVPEMHDRIIVGLAHRLNVPLVTSDPLIVSANLVQVLW